MRTSKAVIFVQKSCFLLWVSFLSLVALYSSLKPLTRSIWTQVQHKLMSVCVFFVSAVLFWSGAAIIWWSIGVF